MGQEIVHCSVCGLRLRGSDFGAGATRLDGNAYCRDCAREVGVPVEAPAEAAPSQDKSTGRIPVQAASSGSKRNTTRRIAAVHKNSTSRIPIPTPRRGVEAVPAKSSGALIWGGVAAVTVVLLLAAAVLGRSTPKLEVPDAPAPAPRYVAKPAPERAPAPVVREPVKPESPRPPSSRETADLAALEKRVTEAVSQERFRDALDYVEAERRKHDSLEWTAGVQRCASSVDAAAKKVYEDLQNRIAAARRQGADTEARTLIDRIGAWGLSAYPAVREAAPAPPPGAPVPAPAPDPVAEPVAPVAAVAPALPSAAPIPFVAGRMKWAPLTPLRATSTANGRFQILGDNSVLAEGEAPATDRYTVVLQSDLKTAAALRLEVLPDPSLGSSGPGRHWNGNFVLTEIQVQALPDAQAASGSPVVLERAVADHEQDGWPIAAALDGKNDTGWAVLPQTGRAHDAIFEFRSPLISTGPLTLLVVLDHQSIHVGHQIGRFRLSLSPVKGAAAEIGMRPPPTVDQAPIDAAIAKGLEWLRKCPSPGQDFPPEKKIGPIRNCDELLLLTFLHSGVAESDPRFQQLLASVLAAPYEHVYPVAIRAMALEELDRVRYQSHIARCAQFLVDNQLASGQWTYGEPTVAVESIRAELPAATGPPRTASTSPRAKPKVVQRISVRPTRSPAGNGDFSNCQYAALGLRACVDAGIVIPKEVFSRASQALIAAQIAPAAKDPVASLASGRKPRGWCYDFPCACPLHRAYGSTTAGGVSTLAIYDHLLGRDAKKDTALLDGLAWLQVNYAIDTNPGPIEFDKISKNTWVPYYLYALERSMILTGNERLGSHPWYADGVRYLLQTQKPDGSWAIDDWGRDTWDTCFALLFLKRSTRPLVATTDSK